MTKKIGRPRLASKEARGKFISTRVSPPEYSQIHEAIHKSRKAKTEWVRDILVGASESKVLILLALKQQYTPAAYSELHKFMLGFDGVRVGQSAFVIRSGIPLKELEAEIVSRLANHGDVATVFPLTGHFFGNSGTKLAPV